VSAATDKGECDGDVTDGCDDVIGGGCSDAWFNGLGPDRGPPNEQRAAAELIRPRLPPGEVR
jgi:hypothetical protein